MKLVWYSDVWKEVGYQIVFNVYLKELNRLLVGETSHLGVGLREWDGSDSPNN